MRQGLKNYIITIYRNDPTFANILDQISDNGRKGPTETISELHQTGKPLLAEGMLTIKVWSNVRDVLYPKQDATNESQGELFPMDTRTGEDFFMLVVEILAEKKTISREYLNDELRGDFPPPVNESPEVTEKRHVSKVSSSLTAIRHLNLVDVGKGIIKSNQNFDRFAQISKTDQLEIREMFKGGFINIPDNLNLPRDKDNRVLAKARKDHPEMIRLMVEKGVWEEAPKNEKVNSTEENGNGQSRFTADPSSNGNGKPRFASQPKAKKPQSSQGISDVELTFIDECGGINQAIKKLQQRKNTAEKIKDLLNE